MPRAKERVGNAGSAGRDRSIDAVRPLVCDYCKRSEVPVHRRGICQSCYDKTVACGLPLPPKLIDRGGAGDAFDRLASHMVSWGAARRAAVREALDAADALEAASQETSP